MPIPAIRAALDRAIQARFPKLAWAPFRNDCDINSNILPAFARVTTRGFWGGREARDDQGSQTQSPKGCPCWQIILQSPQTWVKCGPFLRLRTSYTPLQPLFCFRRAVRYDSSVATTTSAERGFVVSRSSRPQNCSRQSMWSVNHNRDCFVMVDVVETPRFTWLMGAPFLWIAVRLSRGVIT